MSDEDRKYLNDELLDSIDPEVFDAIIKSNDISRLNRYWDRQQQARAQQQVIVPSGTKIISDKQMAGVRAIQYSASEKAEKVERALNNYLGDPLWLKIVKYVFYIPAGLYLTLRGQ